MKLQVNVENNQAYSPANAPQTAGSAGAILPQPSTKNNLPTSSGVMHGGWDSLMSVSLGFMAIVLWNLWVLQI